MERLTTGEVELEYTIRGTGEPILLIHGAHIADALRPLVAEPALEGFQTVAYHRRGYAGSSRPPGPTSANDHARDAIGLLDRLAFPQAHIVGHSYGAMIALTLATIHPTRVRSLALLEPPALAGPAGAAFLEAVAPLAERYRRGDPVGAVHSFLALIGPDWRTVIDRAVPGGIEQAEQDAATFFEIELPAIARWSFDTESAAAASCPVLSVLGTASAPLFVEGRRLLHTWFLHCQDADIAGATHYLPMEQPQAVATILAAFFRGRFDPNSRD
jgi:pimeloyl-ACP methyl ester carboxylesterase